MKELEITKGKAAIKSSNDFYTLLGLVAVKDKQPTETGDYEISRDGKKFSKCHFDTFFGWQFLLNPELYYWRKCN